MALLIFFAFIAGVITVLSPCILPLLPIILSSSDTRGYQKPVGVVTGFVASFTIFTLFLSTLVRVSGIPAESLRFLSILILGVFGLTLLLPAFQVKLEVLFGKLAIFAPSGQNRTGFTGGLVIGFSLGLLWTPCVGPILASVISLAITGTVTAQAFFITLSYAAGTAIPMFAIMLTGSTALKKVPWLVKNSGNIQKGFGVLMIATALGIYFGIDRQFQTYILNAFPNYGSGLTKIEDNEKVKIELQKQNTNTDKDLIGKPMLTNQYPQAPELVQGGTWFNSKPLKLAELKGKVVLVDFWTYSCINCIRTLPYLKTWWEKYEDKGLVIVGVHTPEFEFEKDPKNVQIAINDFGLKYPVMQDNDFGTWRAYENRYWPAKYLIDKDGAVRYVHFGEGKYDETESMIQKLLQEAGTIEAEQTVKNPTYSVFSQTPELYLGYGRMQYFDSPEQISTKSTNYSRPTSLKNNHFAYQGNWAISSEFAAPSKGAKLYVNFEAKEVFLVARPKNGASSIKIKIDGKVGEFGEDNKNGTVLIDSDRLYKLIKLSTPGRHELEIEFDDDNVEVFAFTFG